LKTAVSLTALLAGLCAACVAAPLSQEIPSRSEFLVAGLTRGPATAWVDPWLAELDVASPQPSASNTYTPAMTFGDAPVGEISYYDNPEAFGSGRIPEPPPFISLWIAIASIGILGLYRLNYRPRKRRSRRHMRPLTVLR
jgi:hypothetical protein